MNTEGGGATAVPPIFCLCMLFGQEASARGETNVFAIPEKFSFVVQLKSSLPYPFKTLESFSRACSTHVSCAQVLQIFVFIAHF